MLSACTFWAFSSTVFFRIINDLFHHCLLLYKHMQEKNEHLCARVIKIKLTQAKINFWKQSSSVVMLKCQKVASSKMLKIIFHTQNINYTVITSVGVSLSPIMTPSGWVQWSASVLCLTQFNADSFCLNSSTYLCSSNAQCLRTKLCFFFVCLNLPPHPSPASGVC